MTDRIIQWINANRLMQFWQLMPGELLQLCDGKIQAYLQHSLYSLQAERPHQLDYHEIEYEECIPTLEYQLEKVWFKLEDKLQFEKDHPEIISQPLTKKEAQELGLLRREKVKSDLAMKAVGAVVQWQLGQEYKLTQATLKTFMKKHFGIIAGKTWNKKIWDALPKEIKNSGKGAQKEPMP